MEKVLIFIILLSCAIDGSYSKEMNTNEDSVKKTEMCCNRIIELNETEKEEQFFNCTGPNHILNKGNTNRPKENYDTGFPIPERGFFPRGFPPSSGWNPSGSNGFGHGWIPNGPPGFGPGWNPSGPSGFGPGWNPSGSGFGPGWNPSGSGFGPGWNPTGSDGFGPGWGGDGGSGWGFEDDGYEYPTTWDDECECPDEEVPDEEEPDYPNDEGSNEGGDEDSTEEGSGEKDDDDPNENKPNDGRGDKPTEEEMEQHKQRAIEYILKGNCSEAANEVRKMMKAVLKDKCRKNKDKV